MLENIIKDNDFASLMQNYIENLVIHFFQKEQNFGILCKVEDVRFEPELPHDIIKSFRPLTLFVLAGYTFQSAYIEDEHLIFEAGFGADNFGSVVHVPLLSIMQIIIEETPIFINLATPDKELEKKQRKKIDKKGVENSMASFLSNPENSKFLKN